MMDRNLGATSANPGDVEALGLLYQWGRKDPFLGASSLTFHSYRAASTIIWPKEVSSNATTGTIAYAKEHPTTFITYNSNNFDWYYTTSSFTDNTRWQSSKTIYDPCPPGYRVPDGGKTGVWSKALGSSSSFTDLSLYDSIKDGFNFAAKFGNAPTIWYPLSGRLTDHAGELYRVCEDGLYWAVTPIDNHAYHLSFFDNGRIYPSVKENRTVGCVVRCCKE